MSYIDFLPKSIVDLYEVHNFRNAVEILATGSKPDFIELMNALSNFRITLDDIRKPGGNESDIPKKISALLRDKGWKETRIKGDLNITKVTAIKNSKKSKKVSEDDENTEMSNIDEIELLKKEGAMIEIIKKENFLDGHKVDYVKNRIAFDVEWNSKDQTFDRDLYAFRAFYETDLIDAAVLMTRSANLNPIFEKLGPELNDDGTIKMKRNNRPKMIKEKYGASTTWMDKLLYRITAGRNGGCPVLVLGIGEKLILDIHTLI